MIDSNRADLLMGTALGKIIPQGFADYLLTNAIHKYTNVLWTHQADMLASHVAGV